MRRTTTLGLLMAFFAVLLPIAVLAPPAQAAGLPGGRSTYVVAVMGGTNLHMYSKLATYQFATNGTVTQKYWYWRQDSVTGYNNSAWTKPASGYTTTGCRYACPIRTPIGFQRGTTPKSMAGIWRIDAYGHLYIKWTATAYETWILNSSQAGFVALTAMHAYNSQRIQRGWGFGSNAGQNQGVNMGTVHASTQLMGPLSHNYFGVPTRMFQQSLYFPNYQKCTNGVCLQSNENATANKSQRYHSYLAGNPAVDGRKVFWDHQTGAVQQTESPTSNCIGWRGGHVSAALQVIADNGKFLGLVGVEASLDRQAYQMAQVSAWTGVRLPMLTTIAY